MEDALQKWTVQVVAIPRQYPSPQQSEDDFRRDASRHKPGQCSERRNTLPDIRSIVSHVFSVNGRRRGTREESRK